MDNQDSTSPGVSTTKGDHSLHKEMKYQAEKLSWKDEVWTAAISWPILMAFIPGLQVFAEYGFKIMSSVPAWYVTLVGICVAYAFHRKVFSLYGMLFAAGKK